MSKRLTDTNKYKKPFIRSLSGPYKLLWDYLYHDCDHAGIWIVDFEIAQLYIGRDMLVNKEDAIRFFNSGEQRIIEINGGSKWFIPSFIEFQYGELNEQNRAHNSVIQILKKYNLYENIDKGLISPLEGCKDKYKDKDNKGGVGEKLNNKRDEFSNEIIEKSKDKYPVSMVSDFIAYWTEPNKINTTLRFESEKFFDIPRRLAMWNKKSNNQFISKDKVYSYNEVAEITSKAGKKITDLFIKTENGFIKK